MAETRIYVVTSGNDTKHLIDAANPAQAIRHITRNKYSAKVVTTKELAALLGDGVNIEIAASE